MTIKSNGYNVHIGKGVFKSLSAFLNKHRYTSYFILCDENTLQECLPLLITYCPELNEAHVIEIEHGEASKSLNFCAHIWQTLIENRADKNSLLINLGGGVVSDLGGFTASVYKRGIDFINIPTSLLAMADASVGGKTGIDFANLKNSIGTFSQPKVVFINPGFLLSLSERHFQNGLAEIYKIALVSDKKFWKDLNEGFSAEILVQKSIELKNKICLIDPFDKGIRKTLNFGHTLGHAFEALSLGTENELLHGEAIIIGMITESHIAFQKKLLSKKDFSEILNVITASFELKSISNLSFNLIMELLKNDKKIAKNKLMFSLINKIGTCKFDIEVSETQIKKAIDYYNSLVK